MKGSYFATVIAGLTRNLIDLAETKEIAGQARNDGEAVRSQS